MEARSPGGDPPDRLTRAELAVVLQKAASMQARAPSDDGMSVHEAEALAAEVGIAPAEFREAVRLLRSKRELGKGWFGPSGVLGAEARVPRAVGEGQALRMLAEAQVPLSIPGGSMESPAAGLWRLSDRSGTLLQISTHGEKTTLAATLDRKRLKAGLIGGGGFAGMMLGAVAVPAIAMVTWGTVDAMVIANVAGIVGGGLGGVAAGAAVWRATARKHLTRALSALDRMRDVADEPGSPP